MFTEKAQALIDLAKDCAFTHIKEKLDIESLLAAIGGDSEAGVRLAECLTDGHVSKLRAMCPDFGHPSPCPGKMDIDEHLKKILLFAGEIASAIPDHNHPGLVDIRHLVCAVAASDDACRKLGEVTAVTHKDVIRILSAWYQNPVGAESIADLITTLRELRSKLLANIFGQDHAIQALIDGLYNAEMTASADKKRMSPTAVFVFAGPPGVGKTYTAELAASYLGRPFKRFDMTSFSDHQANNSLIGFAPSYKDAHPGLLTGFVEKNHNCILLFDEIEKAHLTTVQLFYQILDAGHLEDKYTEQDINFRDTIVIFTTNAGRSLYDNPNKVGIHMANATYHKKTILSALENEKNPADGRPAFPKALCSRLSQGYAVMFNHLGVNELERVCDSELVRTEALLEKQYYKKVSHDELVPITLVFREGGLTDARQLRAEAEKFIKDELFNYYSLYSGDNLEEVFNNVKEIRIKIDDQVRGNNPEMLEMKALFESPDRPHILLIANDIFAIRCKTIFPEIDWLSSTFEPEIMDILSTQDIDMVLLDLWVKKRDGNDPVSLNKTIHEGLDYIPLSARALDHGRKILQKIHERSPQTATYLLSLSDGFLDIRGDMETQIGVDRTLRRPIDDELFLACVRAGGARGVLSANFMEGHDHDREKLIQQFKEKILGIHLRLYREKKARSLAQERKALSFNTAAELGNDGKEITIRLRNFSLSRTIDAKDAGEMVDDVKRPNTRFDDVLGAREAKEALQFVVNWLKSPKQYTAMGIRPPKGYLLTGPPGTGKTMLARAVAGESNCAFLEKSASSFVTIWQGSGPQNIRDLFERARRYAPAVVFLDEIDAIGAMRGGSGGKQSEESTLNALLTEMDGFGADKQSPVIVLAATNLSDRLDAALKRRFDGEILVDKPDKEARLKYLKDNLLERGKTEVSLKAIERMAGQTTGSTIADLERVIHVAAVTAAREGKPITDDILAEAYDRQTMGAKRETIDKKALLRTARHEGGHAIISWLGGNPPVRLTVIGRAIMGGFMEPERDENKGNYTKPELEQMICVSMAGRAAEILYYGQEQGFSTGVESDLERASFLAEGMIKKWGMTQEFGQVAMRNQSAREIISDGPLAEKISIIAEKIIKTQLDRAVELLKKNQSSLDTVVDEVLEKNTLYKEDLDRILPPFEIQGE